MADVDPSIRDTKSGGQIQPVPLQTQLYVVGAIMILILTRNQYSSTCQMTNALAVMMQTHSFLTHFEHQRNGGNPAIFDGEDEYGKHVELHFTREMAKVILQEDVELADDEIATSRVYISDYDKRAVVAKDDDILTKREILKTKAR